MNLLEDEQINTKSKNTKTIMIVIIVLIVFLVIISGVLLYLITTVENSTIKLNLDGQNKTFADDMFLIEDDKLYIAIRDFGELMGYSSFNGDYKNRRYSENTSDCYISSSDEIASYSLNSNTMYKKVTENEDYEYFDLDEPVRFQNNKLYVIAEGMEIGTNCIIDFNPDNNQITVYSLNYLISLYSPQFPNAAIIADDADFNNKKALRYGMVVIFNETDGYYGVYSTEGNEIIGPKYTDLQFKEDSKEFTVTTDEGRMGILSSDGTTKIEPNYNEIKQISTDLDYYLVSNNDRYGVINHNGNIIIHLEYNQIGVDESRFNSNGIDNPYILFDNCIPVMQNNKWGLFDIHGNVILPVQYDQMGCVVGTQTAEIGNNVLVIPQYEAIVLGQGDKYGIYSALGEEYVQMALDTVYSQTIAGEEKYYMTFTRQVEENGELVDRQETYDVDQYFERYVDVTLQNPQTPEINQNSIVTNTTTDTNTTTGTENTNSAESTVNNAETQTEGNLNIMDNLV